MTKDEFDFILDDILDDMMYVREEMGDEETMPLTTISEYIREWINKLQDIKGTL